VFLLRGLRGLLVSLMMALSVGPAQTQETPWDRLAAEGRRLRAEGRYADARKAYEAAHEGHHTQVRGEAERAIRRFLKAIGKLTNAYFGPGEVTQW